MRWPGQREQLRSTQHLADKTPDGMCVVAIPIAPVDTNRMIASAAERSSVPSRRCERFPLKGGVRLSAKSGRQRQPGFAQRPLSERQN